MKGKPYAFENARLEMEFGKQRPWHMLSFEELAFKVIFIYLYYLLFCESPWLKLFISNFD